MLLSKQNLMPLLKSLASDRDVFVPATIDGVSYVIADEAALADMMRTIDAGGDPNA